MPPELMPFEYHYSTYQRIVQSFHKTSTRHYTNSNICTKYLRLTYQIVHNQLKVTWTCSRPPLSCLLWGRFLSDIDQIGHRCNRPLHLPRAHLVDYVANRTSQPEYMSYILSGGCGDIPLKALGYFMKPSHQRERLVFIPFWELHDVSHGLSSIFQFP